MEGINSLHLSPPPRETQLYLWVQPRMHWRQLLFRLEKSVLQAILAFSVFETLGASCCTVSLWELASTSQPGFYQLGDLSPPPPFPGCVGGNILLLQQILDYLLHCPLVRTNKGREFPLRLQAKFQAKVLFCLFLQFFLHLDPQPKSGLHTLAEVLWSQPLQLNRAGQFRGGGVSFKKMFEEVLKNTGFYFLLPLESYCLVVLVGLLEVTVEIQ